MRESGRQKTIHILALRIISTQISINEIRAKFGGLKVKDMEALEKLDKAISEAAEYLAGELEAME